MTILFYANFVLELILKVLVGRSLGRFREDQGLEHTLFPP